jgi:prepilin-type N-terminal cleavage/methylation domain-containing protein
MSTQTTGKMPFLRLSEVRTKGFTLIELLIVMVILGVLAAIAIPGFSVWLPNYRLKSAASALYSNLQLAKLKAIRTNGDYAVLFDAGNGRYQIISGGADRDYSTAGDNDTETTVLFSTYGSNIGYGHGNAGAPVDAVRGFDNEVTFNDSVEGDDIVIFNYRGMINPQVNSGGEVYLHNTKNITRAIEVGPTGVITLQKWTNGAWE